LLFVQGAATTNPDDRHQGKYSDLLYLQQGTAAAHPDDEHQANDKHEAIA
jgi:hypothetical protein